MPIQDHNSKLNKIKEMAERQIKEDLENIGEKYKKRIAKIKLKKDSISLKLLSQLDKIQESWWNDRNSKRIDPTRTKDIVQKLCAHILNTKTKCELVNEQKPFVVIVDIPNKDFIVVRYSIGAVKNTQPRFFSTMLLQEIGRYAFRCRAIPKLGKKHAVLALLTTAAISVFITKLLDKEIPVAIRTLASLLPSSVIVILLTELLYRRILRKHQGPQSRLIDYIVTHFGYGQELAALKKHKLYGYGKEYEPLKTSDLVHLFKKAFTKDITPEQSICLIYAQLANKHRKDPYMHNYYLTLLKENNCHRYF